MIENGVDHFLVAVHHLADAFGKTCLDKQFCKPHRQAWVTFAWLDDEGITRRNRGAAHPQRDHAGEVERRNACTNANRLAHRIDVDAGASPLSIFALQHMWNAAAKFDDFKPALDIALTVGDNLAVFGRQHMRQIVHIGLDQPFEFKHHPRTPLRVGHRPSRLRRQCRLHRTVKHYGIAQCDLRLHCTIIWIEHITKTCCRRTRAARYEMVNLAHNHTPDIMFEAKLAIIRCKPDKTGRADA